MHNFNAITVKTCLLILTNNNYLTENHNYDLTKAMSKVIHQKIGNIGGDGGMIGIDKNSNVVMDFNTAGMYRAFVNKNGQKQILLYDK